MTGALSNDHGVGAVREEPGNRPVLEDTVRIFPKRKTPAKVSDEERAKLKIREQIKLENPFQTH
jgi:hypothetical protein